MNLYEVMGEYDNLRTQQDHAYIMEMFSMPKEGKERKGKGKEKEGRKRKEKEGWRKGKERKGGLLEHVSNFTTRMLRETMTFWITTA